MTVQELLSTPNRWTQGTLARASDGRKVSPEHPEAVAWCLVGAVLRCYGHDGLRCGDIIQKLTSMIPEESIPHWNDSRGRTWDEVIELARRVNI